MKIAFCHPNRKHKARGLCGACYDRALRDENPEYGQRQAAQCLAWIRANKEKVTAGVLRRKKIREADPKLMAEWQRRRRGSMLTQKYGITLDDYERLLKEQQEGCAICTRKSGAVPLHVDHCHKTGIVRGLLCHQCNWYLGTLEHDDEVVVRLLAYLDGIYASQEDSSYTTADTMRPSIQAGSNDQEDPTRSV